MDNQTEEGVITFAQIWRVVKRSFARAAIYVVVCVIVSFAVLYAVKSVSATNTYSATITFKQSDENIKSTLDGYRASATNKAVEEVFSASTSVDTTEVYETVLETLTITAYVPEAYEDDTSYVSTIFTVSFNELDIDGVSASQQVSLLDNICSELISYYSEISSTSTISSSLAWSYAADYNVEYLDVISELSTRLSSAKSTLSSNISANVAVNSQFSTYRGTSTDSNRRTAYEILAQFDNLQYTISSLEDTVLASGITNANAALNGADYCDNKIASYKIQLDSLQTLADSYAEQIKTLGEIIQNGVSSAASYASNNGSATVAIDISSYTALVEQYLSVQSDIATVQSQIDEVTLYKTNITNNTTGNAANMTATESTINTVISDVSALLEEYNDLVEEFEEQIVPSNYATISKAAAAYKDSLISTSLLLIGVVAVAVIGYVVAFAQTWSQMKKNGTLDEDKPLPLKKDESKQVQ